ncbi:MAG: hypothetical protein NXH75_01495 [Halobacteriovoraceae bacterium]|nr:hypothetical protein [Halobacteriovoraceae bacterium]
MITSISLLLFWLTKLDILKKLIPSIVTLVVVLLLQAFELQLYASEPKSLFDENSFLIPFMTLVFGGVCIYFKKPLSEVVMPLFFASFTMKFGNFVNLYTLVFFYWILMIASRPIKGRLEKIERYVFPIVLLFIHLIFKSQLINTSTLQNLPYFTNKLNSQELIGILILSSIFIVLNEALRNTEAFLKRGDIFSLASLVPIVLLFSMLKRELSYSYINIDMLLLLFTSFLYITKTECIKNRLILISLIASLSILSRWAIWLIPIVLLFHPILLSFINSKERLFKALPTVSLMAGILLLVATLLSELGIFQSCILVVWLISLINATNINNPVMRGAQA